jgi:hypothetical protein
MLKNITLSAEEALKVSSSSIERARQRAEAESTTLNAGFRRWLTQYAEHPQSASDFRALMDGKASTIMVHLNYAQPGKVFSREELNER